MKRTAVLLLTSALCLTACDSKEPPKPLVQPAPKSGGAAGMLDAAKEKAGAATDAAKAKVAEVAADVKAKAVEAAQSTVNELSGKLDDLRKKATGAAAAVMPPEVKKSMDSAVGEVETQFKSVKASFDTLKTAGADAWEKAKTGFESSVTKFNDALGAALKAIPGSK